MKVATALQSEAVSGGSSLKPRVPEWLYCFSDDQFVSWCIQHKLMVCESVRFFSDDERAAIFRYAVRMRLLK